MPPTKPSVLDCMLDDHREATRFVQEPGTDFAVVWQLSGSELLVEVHDESLTGLGIVMTDVGTFHIGSEATIVYQGHVLHCEVKHLEEQFDGTWLVGWECRQ